MSQTFSPILVEQRSDRGLISSMIRVVSRELITLSRVSKGGSSVVELSELGK